LRRSSKPSAPAASCAVELTLRERGRGLAAEVAEKTFELFFTTKSDGLGMGLAINRTLVEAPRGELRATPNGRRADAATQATRARLATLTRRERQVMTLLVNGQSNKAVAKVREISTKKVEIHQANVMRKMEAKSIAERVKMGTGDDQAG